MSTGPINIILGARSLETSRDFPALFGQEIDLHQVGSPIADGTLVGPLIHDRAHKAMQEALDDARHQGGTLVVGRDRRFADEAPDAYYVEPAVVRMPEQTGIVRQETFAPTSRRDRRRASSPPTRPRPSGSSPSTARTGAWPTSTSGPPAPRSVGLRRDAGRPCAGRRCGKAGG